MKKSGGIKGYIINRRIQQRKARQQFEQASAKKPKLDRLGEPEEDRISDDSTPVESDDSRSETNIETPNTNQSGSTQNSTMDIDNLNLVSDPVLGIANADRSTRAAGGSSNGAGLSASGGLRGQAALPTNNRQFGNTYTLTFKKQYLFRLVNEQVETRDWNHVVDHSHSSIRYPFHDIPVHMLGFYLSKSEIGSLMNFTTAKVKHVQVEVFNKTGCLNFETASSVSTIGNNNIGIYLCQLDPTISKKRSGYLPSQHIFIEERCWGNPYNRANASNEWNKDNAHLGSQYVRRKLDNRFEYNTVNVPDTWPVPGSAEPFRPFFSNYSLPLFNPMSFIIMRKNVSMEEGLFTTFEYKPKDGLIAGQFTNIFGSNLNENTNLVINKTAKVPSVETHPDRSNTSKFQPTANSAGTSTQMDAAGFNPEAMNNWRYMNYEQTEFSKMTIDNETLGGEFRPPQLIIGIEPLVTELNDKWEPVNAYVDIYINATCTVEITQGVDYINSNSRSMVMPNYMFPRYQPTVNGSNGLWLPICANYEDYTYDSNALTTGNRYFKQPNRLQEDMNVVIPTVAYSTRSRSHIPQRGKDRPAHKASYLRDRDTDEQIIMHNKEIEDLKNNMNNIKSRLRSHKLL